MSTREELATQIALAFVETLRKLDEEFDVSSVVQSVKVTCGGPGNFQITLEADDVDAIHVNQEITKALKGPDDEQGG